MKAFIEKYLAWFELGGALLVIAAIFAVGWTVQGWRKDVEIADLKRGQAESTATQSKAALDDLISAGKTIHAAAAEFGAIQDTLGGRFDALQKELKDVQQKTPLPVDCKPGADRLRLLKAAVDAANAAAAR